VDFRWVGGEVDREGKARNVGRYGHFLRRAAILAGRRAGLALPYLHVPKASGGEAFMALWWWAGNDEETVVGANESSRGEVHWLKGQETTNDKAPKRRKGRGRQTDSQRWKQ